MVAVDDDNDGEDLRQAVERYRRRQEMWRREGGGSLAHTLALVRSLGWMIALPTVMGVFAGRWLDLKSGGGVLWTAGLMILGLGIGCWMAWTKLNSEE